jgi:uncharacterized protein YndB with AHSA1/START domain
MTSASLNIADEGPVLRFERRLAHAVEKVWTAITDPAELAHWFPAPFEAELKPGAPIEWPGELSGEVLEIEHPTLFVYRWGSSVLRWELVPEGTGCRLIFTHALGGEEGGGDLLSVPRTAAGWDTCLARLEIRLAGRTETVPDEFWQRRNEHYFEEFGLGDATYTDGVWRFEREIVADLADVRALIPATGDARWEVRESAPIGVRLTVTPAGEPTPELLAEWHLRVAAFATSVFRTAPLRERYRRKLQSHSQ